jgi:excinuclease ABC subunit C
VWERGRLKRDQYRSYRIEGQNAGDDYMALQEVIKRRFTGTVAQQMPAPDLLLIDGGKGQLSRATEIVRTLGEGSPEVASISKAGSTRKKVGPTATDEIYIPERANPLKIPGHSRTLHLLQMMRDEAHRFALSSHRRSRGKDDLLSRLDGIKGIGPVRRKLLLNSFRSLDEIRAAPVEDIAALKGFNRSVARKIKEDLK